MSYYEPAFPEMPRIEGNIFEGKSEAEIIKKCENYLGKIEPVVGGGFIYSNSIHPGSSEVRFLASKVNDIKNGVRHQELTPEEEIKYKLDSSTIPLETTAYQAIEAEVKGIYKSYIGYSDSYTISQEEIKRRFQIIKDVYGDRALSVMQHIASRAVPSFFFELDKEEIKNRREDIVQGGVNTFVNLSKTIGDMGLPARAFYIYGVNLVDVGKIIQERLDLKIKNPEETKQEPTIEQNDEVSTNYDEQDAELIEQIKAKQEEINKLQLEMNGLVNKLGANKLQNENIKRL